MGWGFSAAETAGSARVVLAQPACTGWSSRAGLGWRSRRPSRSLGASFLKKGAPGWRGDVICLQLRQKHTACTVNLHKLMHSGRDWGEKCKFRCCGCSGRHPTEGAQPEGQVRLSASLEGPQALLPLP